ncbi:MAG TPA: translation initiation factor IF-2, partial [Nitrososphaera sp.]|nr:translation initiation factor IF-2 [Nitrososphaera sp.]
MELRQPIVVVLGHVDSGKTSLLDNVRGTAVQAREVGGITQHIGASFLPVQTIKEITGPLYTKLVKTEAAIPGLLVIDTPGHEVFANLRTRGGSAADIAIVVVDVNKGFEAQTIESMDILKKRRVPFVIALNKLDMVAGWRTSTRFISEDVKRQDAAVQTLLDEKIYSVVGILSRLGYQSEGFWRVKDFTKEVAIVPVSARTGVGIAELLAVLVGLTQQYMGKKLERHIKDAARGIILEFSEETGLGPSANIILLDGILHQGDSIVVGKRDGAVSTRIKALLLPKPLDEMRDPRDKFKQVNEVIAAAGLKITSPDLEGVLAGSPVYVYNNNNNNNHGKNKDELDHLKSLVESEVKNAIVSNTQTSGVILKCDTIGSLEAIVDLLKKANVPIRIADIGNITRRDIVEAAAVKENNRYLGVMLGFNVKVLEDAQKEAQDR